MAMILAEHLGFKQDWQDKRIYYSPKRTIEICLKFGRPRLTLSVLDDEGFTLCVGLIFLNFYFKVPPFSKIAWGDVFNRSYGFYIDEDALVLEWDRWRKFFYFPWSLVFYKRWEQFEAGYGSKDKFWIEINRGVPYNKIGTKYEAEYNYTLKNGEVQKRIAIFSVNKTERRRRYWRWLPLLNLVRESISVEFNDEVGERTGSWKGGCVWCDYEMLSGEEPLQTLRRMEFERRFT